MNQCANRVGFPTGGSATIPDGSVSIAKLQNGTPGRFITYSNPDGTPVEGDALSSADVTFDNFDTRFFGEKGTLNNQGWDENATGGVDAEITYFNDTVFGNDKQIINFSSGAGTGLNIRASKELTSEDWTNILHYGGSYSGILKCTIPNLFSGAGFEADNDPRPTSIQSRVGVYFIASTIGGNYIRTGIQGSGFLHLDGLNGRPRVRYGEYFAYEAYINPTPDGGKNFGIVELYINGILVQTGIVDEAFNALLNNVVTVANNGMSKAVDVSFDNFGITGYKSSSERLLLPVEMATDEVNILMSEGKRKQTIIVPDGNPRKIGSKIHIIANNVGGTITLKTQDHHNPKTLFNGLHSYEIGVNVKKEFDFINQVNDANVYQATVSHEHINGTNVEISKDGELEAYSTGGVITIDEDMVFTFKNTITTSVQFNLIEGATLTLRGWGKYVLIWTGTDTFISSNLASIQVIQLITEATNGGTFIDFASDDNNSIVFDGCELTGWKVGNVYNIPTSSYGGQFYAEYTGFYDWQGGLTCDNTTDMGLSDCTLLQLSGVSANEPFINLNSNIPSALYSTGITGALEVGENLIRIDPQIPNDSRISISGQSLSGDYFETNGINGTFTVVADASIATTSIASVATATTSIASVATEEINITYIENNGNNKVRFTHEGRQLELHENIVISGFDALTNITSVTNNGTIARFNHGGLVMSVGQNITISGFDSLTNINSVSAGIGGVARFTYTGTGVSTTQVVNISGFINNTAYNGIHTVINDSLSNKWFEIDIPFVTDEAGGIISNLAYNGTHAITDVGATWFETAIEFGTDEAGGDFLTQTGYNGTYEVHDVGSNWFETDTDFNGIGNGVFGDNLAIFKHSGDAVYANQEVTISGFVVNTDYNGTYPVISSNTGWFKVNKNFGSSETVGLFYVNGRTVARFNYTGDAVYANQEVVISGYTGDNDVYNGTHPIANTATGWFEVATPFISNEASGSFLSNSITLTDLGTTLTDGNTITIKGDTSSEYDGGATVYNKQTDTFQVNRTFMPTATQTGIWNTSGLNQKDRRVIATNNLSQVSSHYIGAGFMNGNTEINEAITNGTYTDLTLGTTGGGLTPSSNMERFKLINPIIGEFEYVGNEPFSGFIDYNLSSVSTSNDLEFRYKWKKDSGSGYQDLPDDKYSQNILSATTLNTGDKIPISLIKGDKIKPQLTRVSGASDHTTKDFSVSIIAS